MKKTIYQKQLLPTLIMSLMVIMSITSCGGDEKKKASLTDVDVEETTDDAPINALDQAKQSIMVIPSDKLMQDAGGLITSMSMGKTVYQRDYQKFLLADDNNRQVITTIQKSFAELGFPLVDLEQSLKSLENQNAMDEADGVAKDAKTLLLTTVRPDVIIEVDYKAGISATSRTSEREISYSISVLDAFSNKAIGAINNARIENVKISDNVAAVLSESIESELPTLSTQIQTYFADIIRTGREITFNVKTATGCAVSLQDMYNEDGDCYGDWIREWVKTNAKRGAATMQRNSKNDMYFVNVRINNLNEDGTQFNAYDFANNFRKEFYRTFKVQAVNNTQGLADANILIK